MTRTQNRRICPKKDETKCIFGPQFPVHLKVLYDTRYDTFFYQCHDDCAGYLNLTGIQQIDLSFSPSTYHLSPTDFTPEESDFAKSKGVILKTQYSKTVQGSYQANSCTNCGSFAGDFHLFSQYVAPAGYGQLPSTTFDIGYRCDYCGT